MKALVLAAGLGTRLRPYTDVVPKTMIPVAGRPLLERNVEWLAENGVRDLAVNLHHLPETIRDHFGDGSAYGVRIRYSYEPELLGTAGALRPLAGWLCEGTFLVVYGDNLIRLELSAMLEKHARSRAVATVALYLREDVGSSGVAELDEAGNVVRFSEKPQPGETGSHWVNAGLLACEPALLDAIGDGSPDFGCDVLPAVLAAGGRIHGYRMGAAETLGWIDTPADLHRLEDVLTR